MTNDSGTMKYWADGFPAQMIPVTANTNDGMKYWADGFVDDNIFPAATPSTPTTTTVPTLLLMGVG